MLCSPVISHLIKELESASMTGRDIFYPLLINHSNGKPIISMRYHGYLWLIPSTIDTQRIYLILLKLALNWTRNLWLFGDDSPQFSSSQWRRKVSILLPTIPIVDGYISLSIIVLLITINSSLIIIKIPLIVPFIHHKIIIKSPSVTSIIPKNRHESSSIYRYI